MANFLVGWQFNNAKKMSKANYECHDLPTLMRLLAKSEGVSPVTCAKLFVHYTSPVDGKVIEVVTHENELTLIDSAQTYLPATPATVTNIRTRMKKDKPHVRLKVPEDTVPYVLGGLGLYKATEAR